VALRDSLRARFLVAFLAVVLIADVVMAVGFYYQQHQHSITEGIVSQGQEMHRLSDFQFYVAKIALQDQPMSTAEVQALRSDGRAYVREVIGGRVSAAERTLLERIDPQLEALVRARIRLNLLARSSPMWPAADRLLLHRAAALTATMTESHARLDMRMAAAAADSKAHATAAFRAFVIGTAAATFAALALALLLARIISAPVLRLAAGARELAAGRLEHRIAVKSRDEIGVVAAEFNQMAAQLTEARSRLERRVAERTRELANANRELERHRLAQERLAAERRSLLGRLIAVQEEERTRIARELHDEAGQSLTALRLGVEGAEADLRAGRREQCLARLRTLSELGSDAISELERLVLDLRPAQLDRLGLLSTLRWYLGRLGTQTKTATRLQVTGSARRLDSQIETGLFRIVQEALTNVARHSGARHVQVNVRFSSTAVVLEVRDDGVGFDSDAASVSPTAVGLLGMRERAQLIGGAFTVTSDEGKGTCVRVEVPVPEATR
jgi:signal transduction histidine kinase